MEIWAMNLGEEIRVGGHFTKDLSPTVRAVFNDNSPPHILIKGKRMKEQIYLESHPQDSRIGINETGISQTLASNMGMGGNNTPMTMEDNRMGQYVVRRITPKECERLQGFPDNYTDIGEWIDQKGKKRMTVDAARYKALGNSMAVPVMRFIAQRIDWALAHPITENTAEALDWQPDLF